jgi:hypothetical protein
MGRFEVHLPSGRYVNAPSPSKILNRFDRGGVNLGSVLDIQGADFLPKRPNFFLERPHSSSDPPQTDGQAGNGRQKHEV